MSVEAFDAAKAEVMQELTDQNEALREELAACRDREERQKKYIESLSEQHRSKMEEEVAKIKLHYENENQALRAEVETQKEAIAELHRVIDALNQKDREAQRTDDEATEEIARLKRDLGDREARRFVLEANVKELKDQLAAALQSVAELSFSTGDVKNDSEYWKRSCENEHMQRVILEKKLEGMAEESHKMENRAPQIDMLFTTCVAHIQKVTGVVVPNGITLDDFLFHLNESMTMRIEEEDVELTRSLPGTKKYYELAYRVAIKYIELCQHCINMGASSRSGRSPPPQAPDPDPAAATPGARWPLNYLYGSGAKPSPPASEAPK